MPAFKTFWHFVETRLAGKSTGHRSTIPLCMPLTLSDIFASSTGTTSASELQVWATLVDVFLFCVQLLGANEMQAMGR